ncbi:PAS domain-containing sensor histidine kinase [Salinibacter pepae]|uniref:PAS domain-containing sensor histidine kinase n=1 Tax=Salinibacter pepae TaxID=3040382 RepID=UPI0021E7B267|nr:ATP-binding protein [Salinibacter pepae]
MFDSATDALSRPSALGRRSAFQLLLVVGLTLTSSLLFDVYADWVRQGDPLWTTVLENLVPILLALALPYVGWRPLQSPSGAPYLPDVAKYALVGSLGLGLLAGLVVGVQVLQEEIKPAVIVLQLTTVGGIAGLCVGYSTAQLKEATRDAQDDRNRLENLLDGLPVPVVHGRVEGETLNILAANAAFERAFGHDPEESIGENLYDLIRPGDTQRGTGRINHQALDSGASETYSVYTDITKRKRREERLQTLYARLQLALDVSDTGTFDWEIQADEVIWDETSERLFGYEPGGFPGTFAAWAQRVHPDDLPGVREDIEQAIDAQEEFRTEFRAQIPGGQQRWIEGRGIVEYDDRGEPIRMLGIHTDITERKKREQTLREAKERAEEAARLKSAMLANMSHEIRTPLTSITGFSEVLEQNLSGQHGDFATKIRKSSERLQRTLESVLHLSKLESSVHKLKREEVSLRAVVEDVTAALRDDLTEKSLALQTEIPDSPVSGISNEDALHRICRNLLENAIKFTPAGGCVGIRLLDEGRSATLEIEDSGIGMDPENVPGLFQAFRQESEGMAREYEGSGLGLSIVKRLTDELGGEVDVETEKGEGTCFAVTLPLTDDAHERSDETVGG